MAPKISYIEVTKIPGLAPALRSISAPNFVKSFLQVEPQSAGPFPGKGRIAFTLCGAGDGSALVNLVAAPFYTPVMGAFTKTYEHKLPLQPVECLAEMSKDVVAFEEAIDAVFFEILRKYLPKDGSIRRDDWLGSLQAGKQVLEKKLHPVHGYYAWKKLEHNNGMQQYFGPPAAAIGPGVEELWRHDPGYMVLASTKEHCGVMVTSPLSVEFDVDIPILKLTLSKLLGFLIDPTAFVECHSKEAVNG